VFTGAKRYLCTPMNTACQDGLCLGAPVYNTSEDGPSTRVSKMTPYSQAVTTAVCANP